MAVIFLLMDLHPSVVFLGGLVVIILGAELVLRGAAAIAAMLGIRPIVIGLTVVSVGTSMPELAVGITAVSEGMGPLAVGNIAGTNIVNILFILGLSAAIRPLPLHSQSIKFDVPVMIFTSMVLIVMAIDGVLSPSEGWVLILMSVAYLVMIIKVARKASYREKRQAQEKFSQEALVEKTKAAGLNAWFLNSVMLVGGIALTILGADLLVNGAVIIAKNLGVSESVIGLTIVAIGTSAPEIATTIVATIKNERDVAVGNLVGSGITNILVILGLTCVISSNPVDVSNDVLWFDLPLSAAIALICYPVFRSDKMVSRKEGIIFVSCYLVYILTLILFRA